VLNSIYFGQLRGELGEIIARRIEKRNPEIPHAGSAGRVPPPGESGVAA